MATRKQISPTTPRVPPLWEKVFGDSEAHQFSETTYAGVLIGLKFRENGRWPRAPAPDVPRGVLQAQNLKLCGSMLYAVCPLCHSLNAFLPELVQRRGTFRHQCSAWDGTAPCPGFWIVFKSPPSTCFLQ